MASPRSVLVLAASLVVAVSAGLIRRNVENLDAGKLQMLENDPVQSRSALANDTAAVVEAMLQNLHRLKNYQARETLERLVTRFKILVDGLESQQTHNDVTYHGPSKEIIEPVAPPHDANKNTVSSDILQQNEIPHSHRGQLSLTLLPKEQPKRTGNAELLSPELKTSDSVESVRNVVSPSVTVFQDRSMTTTVSTETDNGAATSETSQLVLPKMNTEAIQPPKAVETKIDDAMEEESEENEDEEDDDDELVSELHQGGFHEEHGAEARSGEKNDFYQPLREQDQLIEVNGHRYDAPTNEISEPFGKSKDWNQPPTSGSEEMDDDYIDDDEANKTETFQYPRQFDDDVKLLNKVIGNLRQVKEILQRMRANEGNSR